MFYLDLFQRLEEQQVRYLLVGGLAMNLHGVPRMTMDVDIALAMDRNNVEAFVELAKKMGLQPVAPVSIESLLDLALLRSWKREKGMFAFALKGQEAGSPTVDILIEPPIDVEAALQRASKRRLKDLSVTLVSLEDLIRLKSDTGRAQDKADIEHLQRLKISKQP